MFTLSAIIWLFVASFTNGDAEFPAFGGKIKHVVALMLENRAFDHMMGFMRANRSDINGCIPEIGINCSNPVDPSQPTKNLVYVSPDAVYIQPGDPDHSVDGTTFEIFGTNSYGNNAILYPAPMNGFVKSYSSHEHIKNDSGEFIMKCFEPSNVPIITTLANEFAVFDNWFADIPGPTEPNRIMSMRGHTDGMAKNAVARLLLGFGGENIFSMLDKYGPSNDSWAVFFRDGPSPLFLEYPRLHPLRFHFMEDFYKMVENNSLPTFTWIDPAYLELSRLEPATDQHPDHDVTKGEKLMKDIYESLRKSDIWEETLFLIFYDEHGGFFDHVTPPSCPNPDGKNSTDIKPSFDFKRLGLRIPAILISPYIEKGSTSPKHPIEGESQYCHSSLIHTMRQEFAPNSPSLSKREEWSLTFEDVINLDKPRTDCPMTLPNIPQSVMPNDWIPGKQKIYEYQQSFARVAALMCNKLNEIDNHLTNQADLAQFTRNCMKEWLDNHK
eukprot:537163_1